jgi:hypothetical protein
MVADYSRGGYKDFPQKAKIVNWECDWMHYLKRKEHREKAIEMIKTQLAFGIKFTYYESPLDDQHRFKVKCKRRSNIARVEIFVIGYFDPYYYFDYDLGFIC